MKLKEKKYLSKLIDKYEKKDSSNYLLSPNSFSNEDIINGIKILLTKKITMSEITKKFPNVMITGDDLTVTNNKILQKAVDKKSCNAAILKVNQAGSLHDALEFAKVANENNIKLITSHRSGESSDSQISHIGIGTGSKLLKVGIVGGERVSKLNELIRISEHDLIHGMIEI